MQDDRPMIGQLLCDQTVIATNHVARQLARDTRTLRERRRQELLSQAASGGERQHPPWRGR